MSLNYAGKSYAGKPRQVTGSSGTEELVSLDGNLTDHPGTAMQMSLKDVLSEKKETVIKKDSNSHEVHAEGNPSVAATANSSSGMDASVKTAIAAVLRSTSTRLFCIGLLSIITGLLVWHWATAYKLDFFINFENIPSPIKVGGAFIGHLQGGEFYIHVLVSLRRISIAYSIAVALGIGIGLVVGRSKTARAAVLPYIEIVRPIPAVAWIPLAILMWPTEESSIVYITFLGALFPIILNTVHGVEQTPEVLVRAALSLGAGRLEIFKHVVLPAALPSIAAGLAIGMGVSWFSLLAGEIISGQYGIGYFTWNAYSLINYPDIIVGMLVIGGLGSLSTYLVRLVMSPALRWKKVSH